MDDLIKQYIEIRDHLGATITQMCEVYLTDIWDPLMRYMIIKDLNQVISKDLSYEYPDFPIEYLPKVKFRVDTKETSIEAGIQIYFNKDSNLYFLGCIEHDNIDYDLYCRESWDPYISHIFYARNGHTSESFEKGAKEPAAQYMMGKMTPLSIAYSFAIEEGFIR